MLWIPLVFVRSSLRLPLSVSVACVATDGDESAANSAESDFDTAVVDDTSVADDTSTDLDSAGDSETGTALLCLLQTADMYLGADTVVDRRYTYTYDADGNVLTDAFDLDANGTADRSPICTYDSAGNLLTWEHDETGDGVADQRCIWSYESIAC